VPTIDTADQLRINDLVAGVEINIPTAENADVNILLQDARDVIISDTLVASLDILNSLILAETEATLQIAEVGTVDSATDATIRNRIAVPVRPERPDRFAVPTRIKPIQRVDVPAPPPVRPMRTLSTILNK
jgi:hypothetical protein